MVKKFTIILAVMLGVYILTATISSTLAFVNLKKIKSQIKCSTIGNTLNTIKTIRQETLLIRPLLKLFNGYNQKLKLLDFAGENPEILRDLLGINAEKNFLLVLQNNTELRPSGGIWGAYGIMKIKDCQIVSFQTNDTYYLDKPNRGKFSPPEGTESIIGDEWRFWNANWSPDFKKSVEQGLFFYKQIDPAIQFDGVIGPNVDYLLSLIKVSGPIKLADHDFLLDENNFIQKMIYEPATPAVVEATKDQPNAISPTEKNYVIADIGKSIINQIAASGKLYEMLDPTLQALSNKDFLLYFTKSQSQSAIEKIGWAGRLDPTDNFVSVVDANFGSKLDFQVDKTITITKIADRQYRVDLNYKNNANPKTNDQPFFTYRDFVRVFVPMGSSQLEQHGGQLASEIKFDDDTGLVYMSSMIILKPSEQETVSFTYEVSANLANKNLQVIRQSGQHATIAENLHN
jgi:hypothetical protein